MMDQAKRLANMASIEQTKAFVGPTRSKLLSAILDDCNAAKIAADTLDEKFLSYLLSMVIQEARTTLRRAD